MATQYRDPQPNPKFWSEEDKRVCYGLHVCPGPVSLESICGTYRWVFMEDDMVGNVEFRYGESDPKVKKKERYPGYPGSLTLSFPSGKEHTPENLTGSFRLLDLEGSFTGLKGYVVANGKSWVNCWKIGDVNWGPGGSDESEDGHVLEVYDLADDDGNKFIAFIWDQGWWGCCPHSSTCLAKKQKDENTLVGLTESERDRVGMYLTGDKVKEKANVEEDIAGDEAERVSNKRKLEDEEKDVKRKREV